LSSDTVARLKVDRGIPSDLSRVPAVASAIERQGYDGCWTGEINHDPFLPLLLAAEHTSRLEIGTSIAVAFARNPMTVANLGWDLQAYSRGRFNLGLGSQVAAHIERRFSMPWSRPVPRMREFIAALRAIWACWHDGTRLGFEGDFYSHTLMTPMFTPEPMPYGTPRVFVAAVGEAMTQMCGEVADGLLAHAFTTKRYADEVTTPALLAGLARAGRSRDEIEVSCPVFVVTGEDETAMAQAAAGVRKQIAFYGSTPAYRGVLELHGWGDLHTELHRLSRLGQWDAMGDLVDDEVLSTFAVVAPLPEVAKALIVRCAGAIDRVMPALPTSLPEHAVTALLEDVRSASNPSGRNTENG
jgi:probable F420-dependent oxidoreductase